MRDILVGLLILVVCFLIGDFIYTEKNTCQVNNNGFAVKERKCGLIKKQFDINIDIFGRLW